MINLEKIIKRACFLQISFSKKPFKDCVKQAIEENITLEQISAIGVIFDANLEDLTNYVLGEICK